MKGGAVFYKRKETILIAAAVLFVCIYFYKFLVLSPLPLMQPDSMGYISYSSTRTVGYPLFLSLVRWCCGSFARLAWLQHLIFFGALYYLSRQLYRHLNFFIVALITFFGVALQVELVQYNFQMLTESLSVSLLMLILGVLIEVNAKPHRIEKFLALSLLFGLYVLLRPINKVALGVWVLLLMHWSRFETVKTTRFRFFALVSVPLVVCLSLGVLTQRCINGVWNSECFFGFNLIGKVSLIAKPNTVNTQKHPAFDQAFIEKVEPVQTFLNSENIPSFQMRYIFSAFYYDYFRFLELPKTGSSNHHGKLDRMYTDIGLGYIRGNVSGYIQDVAMNLMAVWLCLDWMTVKEKLDLMHFLEANQLPYLDKWPYSLDIKTQHYFASPFRVILGAVFLVTFYISCAGVINTVRGRFQKSTLSHILFYLSVLVQLHHFGIALFQAGLPRYSFAMWPAVVAFGACFLLRSYEVYQQANFVPFKQKREMYVAE